MGAAWPSLSRWSWSFLTAPGVRLGSCACYLRAAPDLLSGSVGPLLSQYLSFPIWTLYKHKQLLSGYTNEGKTTLPPPAVPCEPLIFLMKCLILLRRDADLVRSVLICFDDRAIFGIYVAFVGWCILNHSTISEMKPTCADLMGGSVS